MSLATKYRPKEFEDAVSQSSVIKILRKQIETNNIKNAYIFSGVSGTGKTTLARIMSNKINNNQGKPIEIDAASNNGVDYMREVVKSAKERAIDCTYKVIIIDECHVLTNASWQSLLKVIEETPKFTIFIFCTTDPEKIPDTIMNRCQRFNFTRIPEKQIQDRLQFICENENFTNYQESIVYISQICKGQLRNAISLLEQVSDYNKDVTMENTLTVLGGFSYSTMFDILNAIIDGNEAVLFQTLEKLYDSSCDFKVFVNQWLQFIIDVTKYLIFKNMNIIAIPPSCSQKLDFATSFESASSYYDYLLNKSIELKYNIKGDSNIYDTIIVGLLQMCRCK